MAVDLILGTAGHIDHGKTSLIRALTGIETDRLPEEQRRGITIDLGFAELDVGQYHLGIVDVPGHERFVRNMLAGATGMDVVMMVVSAADSVQQQTREHLDILRLLDLEFGVIAVTKCDLVEPAWREIAFEEMRELVAGTFLERAPLVATSAVTGEGLPELREALTAAAAAASQSARRERVKLPFRMAIDRAFSLTGIGTVVTGSIGSGATHAGAELTLFPQELPVRVRGLQQHDRAVPRIERGQRAAINLTVRMEQLERGQELAAPGFLRASRLLTVDLELLPTAPRPLKHRQRVRLHTGTAELMAVVELTESQELQPGDTGFAQLFLSQPVASQWGQPFVIRAESPVVTIGGGRILDPHPPRLRQLPLPVEVELGELLAALGSERPLTRAGAALFFAQLRPWDASELVRTAGVLPEQTEHLLHALIAEGLLHEISVSPTRTLRIHQLVLQGVEQRIVAALEREHDREPMKLDFDRLPLSQRFGDIPGPVFDYALEHLRGNKKLRLKPQRIGLSHRGPQLSQNERALLDQLVQWHREGGLQPPAPSEFAERVTRNQKAIPQLIALAVSSGELVEIARDYYLHREAVAAAQAQIRAQLEAHPEGLTLSDLREALGTTRKYAVPFCEYLDRSGFTIRRGDVRILSG